MSFEGAVEHHEGGDVAVHTVGLRIPLVLESVLFPVKTLFVGRILVPDPPPEPFRTQTPDCGKLKVTATAEV
jgi:hypothetical protein